MSGKSAGLVDVVVTVVFVVQVVLRVRVFVVKVVLRARVVALVRLRIMVRAKMRAKVSEWERPKM